MGTERVGGHWPGWDGTAEPLGATNQGPRQAEVVPGIVSPWEKLPIPPTAVSDQ